MKILLKFYKDADELGLKEEISTSGKQGNVKVEKNSHLWFLLQVEETKKEGKLYTSKFKLWLWLIEDNLLEG